MGNIKKFEDFLDKMRGLLDNAKKQGHIIVRVEDIENTFPELKESEDERIRTGLINGFKECLKTQKYWYNIKIEDILAWLEKQGEKPQGKSALEAIKEEKVDNANKVEPKDYSGIDPHFFKTTDKVEPKFRVGDEIKTSNEESLTITKIDEKGYWSEDLFICGFDDADKWELVEQKSDEVEPKFKPGDWIVHHGTENIYQVVAVIDNQYQLKYSDNYTVQKCADVDRCSRLWDINKDAKDGDVLATDKSVFIYAEVLYNKPYAYCGVDKFGVFKDNCREHDWTNSVDNIYPATKEQRDLLFQKMQEAGYEWDVEKKELKKIKFNPDELIEESYQQQADDLIDMVTEKSAWSDEDEHNIQNIDAVLFYDRKLPEDTCVKLRNFLKTLKQRIGGESYER